MRTALSSHSFKPQRATAFSPARRGVMTFVQVQVATAAMSAAPAKGGRWHRAARRRSIKGHSLVQENKPADRSIGNAGQAEAVLDVPVRATYEFILATGPL